MLSAKLTANYTDTEEKGWIAMLGEAQAFEQSGNPEDAPGLALDALIRGDTLEDRAAAVLAAAPAVAIFSSASPRPLFRSDAVPCPHDHNPHHLLPAQNCSC